MSGYFSRKNDEPDTEPFRRFYAEGGFVDEPEGYAGGGAVKRLLRAFHGSPAKFDAFEANKIGSAYGGSAQGAGHYFSESEDIAKSYGRPGRVEGSPGYTYEVDLNVAPEQLLGWDAPLSRQSGNVQDALSQLPPADVSAQELLSKFLASDLAKGFPSMSEVRSARWAAEDGDISSILDWAAKNGVPGRSVYNVVGGYGPLGADSLGRDFVTRHGQDAVQALGIPGLRYIDQESGALSGATNYVMFPGTEDLINLRRRYAEGGYVGDTSHDIDDVEAGLYGSQNFAGGGKVGSLFKFVKNLVGATADPEDAKMLEALRRHTQVTGNEASQLSLGDGLLSEMAKGTPTNVPMPRDYVEMLANPDAVGTFAHTHPNNAMVPSAPDFNVFAHANPAFNGAKTYVDNWIVGPDKNAAMFVPRLDEQAMRGDLQGGAIGARLFPQYYDAIAKNATLPMMQQIDEMLHPIVRERREAAGGIWTREDNNAISRGRSIMAAAFPHNELRKGGLEMQVDPALEVLTPFRRGSNPLTIGQAWPELIDRLDTLGIAPIKTQDWRGYEEGGPVTDEDYGAYVSQYYADGGEVAPRGYFGGC